MDFLQLKAFFESSPAMRLLRADNIAYVVSFLHRQFKTTRAISIPHSELVAALASFREDIQEIDQDALKDRPETYLTGWCEKRWLRRVLDAGRSEPAYQLTPHCEEVLEFIDRALNRDSGFVGTDSRLRTIIMLLDELVVGASNDPQVHLERLQRDKEAIEAQIKSIQQDGVVFPYGPTRVREQFSTAVDMLRQLQGDFRAVEDKFRDITQRVHQQHMYGAGSRGGILGEALDSEDALKQEDQGISFFEFLRFIQSPRQQSRLQAIIQALLRIEELAERSDDLDVVRRMVTVLLSEAEKVVQTTRRLSSTLRRLLDARVQHERRQLAELLSQIRAAAIKLSTNPPRGDVFLDLDTAIAINSPMARTNWAPPTEFDPIDLAEHSSDEDAKFQMFREYASLRPIDWAAIRSRIDQALSHYDRITLRRLVAELHPGAEVLDLMGYIETAEGLGHLIDRASREELIVGGGANKRRVSLPLVTFVRDSE